MLAPSLSGFDLSRRRQPYFAAMHSEPVIQLRLITLGPPVEGSTAIRVRALARRVDKVIEQTRAVLLRVLTAAFDTKETFPPRYLLKRRGPGLQSI
jgi:hypothetical protein